ncbi:MAG: hypothetical protein LBP61_05455 [Desulfovibrio sp.]|jgi:hypothetical protein|nr:hypothetical protein [Desulfovibrio sp.]
MDLSLFRALRLPALALILFFAVQAAQAAELQHAAAGPAGAAPNAAADTDTAAQLKVRAAIKAGATPVEVELEGTDALGAKLAFQFKDLLNGGTLFALTSQDIPKIRILIATATEFPSRPEAGSVYSALWLYYEKPTSFNSYLAREVGVITPGGVEDLAARLAERTAGIAAKFAYIFEKP